MAAALACGSQAVLSHRSAAALHDLRPDNRLITDVTSPSGRGKVRPGIRAHWSLVVPGERALVDGIPCTSVSLTLFDLAGVVDRRSLERAVERSETLQVLDWLDLRQLAAQAGRRRGVAVLRSIIGANTTPSLVRSELEHRFLDLCGRSGISTPVLNAPIDLPQGRIEVDFLWQSARLIAETDGHATHGTRAAFSRDRLRDQWLAIEGYRVVRFTWSQVKDTPEVVSATLRALLAA